MAVMSFANSTWADCETKPGRSSPRRSMLLAKMPSSDPPPTGARSPSSAPGTSRTVPTPPRLSTPICSPPEQLRVLLHRATRGCRCSINPVAQRCADAWSFAAQS
jgi:hypothetical protein